MEEIYDKHEKISKIFKDCQRMISLFRKEYKIGFERIVKCEIIMNEVNYFFRPSNLNINNENLISIE